MPFNFIVQGAESSGLCPGPYATAHKKGRVFSLAESAKGYLIIIIKPSSCLEINITPKRFYGKGQNLK